MVASRAVGDVVLQFSRIKMVLKRMMIVYSGTQAPQEQAFSCVATVTHTARFALQNRNPFPTEVSILIVRQLSE